MNKCCLGDIAKTQTGPFGSQLHEEDYVDEGTPIVTVEHLGDVGFTTQNLPFVSEKDKKRLSKYLLKEGDIVFSRVGSIDKCVYVKKEQEDWLFSGRCLRVRCDKEKVNPRYLSYYFKLPEFKKMMLNISVGATMPSLNTNLMNSVQLSLLDRKRQDKIASLLNDIDEMIQNNNAINIELESIARTIYDYWFLQFDFADEKGNPYKSSGGKMVWNEELKREIPERWESIKLGEIFDFVKGKIPSTLYNSKTIDLVEYLTIEAVNTGVAQYCNPEDMILTDGEVLMVMDGAASSEVYVGNKGVIGSTFCKLQIKSDYISNSLLYLIMKKHEDIFKKVNTGSTVPHANKNYINDFHICMPIDINKRKELQNTFDDLINKSFHIKKENQELASLRDFLLPLLINGQVGFVEGTDEKKFCTDT